MEFGENFQVGTYGYIVCLRSLTSPPGYGGLSCDCPRPDPWVVKKEGEERYCFS